MSTDFDRGLTIMSNALKPGSIGFAREQALRDAQRDQFERLLREGESMAVRTLGESLPIPPAAQVGDVNSTARGSGARFNAGKVPFELIPLRIIAESYQLGARCGGEWGEALDALEALGGWQETGEREYLYTALRVMGLAGWTDCAKVMDFGRKKYAEWNWSKGMKWSIPLACAARHLMQILDGEDNDKDSGLPHRGHVFANIVMLLTYERTFPEGDDRPRLLATPPIGETA